jgi:hypothetical protein
MQQINVVLPVAGLRPANEISIRGGSRPRYTAVGGNCHVPQSYTGPAVCAFHVPLASPRLRLNYWP